jgi:hypothetical protein
MNEQQKWHLRADAAARAGLAMDAVDLVVMPAFSGKTAASREGRKERLRAYLQDQLAEVSEKTRAAERSPAPADARAREDTRMLESLCAACRGHCCQKGGEHAYLSPQTFKRVLEAQPGLSGEALIDTYLDHVPARTYARSCIYHATSGCALPRELRSDICIRFFCKGLETIKKNTADHPERAIIGVFELGGWFPWVRMRLRLLYRGKARKLRPERWSERG